MRSTIITIFMIFSIIRQPKNKTKRGKTICLTEKKEKEKEKK